jgi:phenylpyruvate tautomerase PptA (4-oxalocrotonate tautomerase family)
MIQEEEEDEIEKNELVLRITTATVSIRCSSGSSFFVIIDHRKE